MFAATTQATTQQRHSRRRLAQVPSMLGGASRFMNLRDVKKMPGFQRGSGSRHNLERRNWRL
jgi:hypothetical protein